MAGRQASTLQAYGCRPGQTPLLCTPGADQPDSRERLVLVSEGPVQPEADDRDADDQEEVGEAMRVVVGRPTEETVDRHEAHERQTYPTDELGDSTQSVVGDVLGVHEADAGEDRQHEVQQEEQEITHDGGLSGGRYWR